jgi:hypothetical protein
VRRAAGALAWLSILAANAAGAFDFDTSTRLSLWSRPQDLSETAGVGSVQLWVRSSDTWRHDELAIKFHGEGWVSPQGSDGNHALDARLREAYVQLSDGPWELRAGWQMFPWGRADGINPTDNLTPRQLTLLTRDLEDQRFGTPALRAAWYSGRVSTSLIWLAGYKPTILPWPAGAPAYQDMTPSNRKDQVAARIELIEDRLEGSLTYFDGFDVLPTRATLSIVGQPLVELGHDRVRIVGADFAKPVAKVIIRGELAHTDASAPPAGSIFALRPQWFAVVGAERTFGQYLDVELQSYYRRVQGAGVPGGLPPGERPLALALVATAQQYDPVDKGLTLRVADQWFNETLQLSVSAVSSVVRKGYLVRPVLTYRATDSWTVSLGANVFGGSDKTIYGTLKDNSAAYLELRRGF